jgi:hypothetical protein
VRLSKSSTSVAVRQSASDSWMTPHDLAKHLVGMVPIGSADSLYDPFRGEGAFYDAIPVENQRRWSEIKEGRDFFDEREPCDWIISNPPFSLLNSVLTRTLVLCRQGFGLVIPPYSLTASRRGRMEAAGFGLNRVHHFFVNGWFGMGMFFVVASKGVTESALYTWDRKRWTPMRETPKHVEPSLFVEE